MCIVKTKSHTLAFYLILIQLKTSKERYILPSYRRLDKFIRTIEAKIVITRNFLQYSVNYTQKMATKNFDCSQIVHQMAGK